MAFSCVTLKCRKRRLRLRLVILSFVILSFVYAFRITLLLLGRDFLYLTRPIWDSKPNVPENLIPHFYSSRISPHKMCFHHGWTSRSINDRPKVIDAFIFSIELDMLEIRLRELWDVVDFFLVVEADKTFTGRSKPLFFSQNKERFSWASEKLLHFIVTELSDKPLKDFDNEAKMRGYMTSFIRSVKPNEGDLIIVGDVDELPSSHTIDLLRSCKGYPPELHLEMQNYIYSFEFRLKTSNWKPHVTVYNPSTFWYHHGRHGSKHRLADAGWHCSFCFRNISDFIFKMTSYSHSDRVTKKELLKKEEIQRKICNGLDIFDMFPEAYTFKDLISQMGKVERTFSTGGIPEYVVENTDKFKSLLPEGCLREDREEK